MERTSIGPYQISDRLGVGGMGEVFKAYDERLERWVAIKRILPDKEEDEGNRERLRREAKATAKLNHPAIVQVYDIFQDGGHDCIVMEYVEGKTLDKVVANSRLPVLDLVRVGQEVAEGLAEAHEKKILHRDLKTENIIITPTGHAKILDFGLAKPLRGSVDPALTAHDQMVGTSRALSPEYASGDDIDHRSDLFQLGILLYEAATGHSPFRAHNTLATLKRVILHHQTPVQEINPDIPGELSDLVDQLLEKEPDDRPADARKVAEELARVSELVASGEHDRGSSPYLSGAFNMLPSSSTNISRRGQRLWLVALLGLLALVAVGFYFVGQRSAGGVKAVVENVPVLLAEFDSQLEEGDNLGASLQTVLRVGLQQARFISLVSRESVEDALQRMKAEDSTQVDRELGLALAKREGIPRVVQGTIIKIGSTYQLGVALYDAASGKSLFSEHANNRGEDDLIPELDRLVQKLRRELGEVLADANQIKPLEKVTTRNLRALEAYTQGIALFDDQDIPGAVPFLEQAVELDPEFAMAHAKLGTAYRNLEKPAQVVEKQFGEALLHTERLTEVEKLYVEGWGAMSRGSPDKIIGIWQKMSNLYAGEWAAHVNLGNSLLVYRNDFDNAAAAFQKYLQNTHRSRKVGALELIGLCHLAMEQEEAAFSYFADSKGLGEETGTKYLTVWTMEGDYEESVAYFRSAFESSTSEDDRMASQLRLAVSSAARGDLDEGMDLADESSPLKDPQAGLWLRTVSHLTLIRLHQWKAQPEVALEELRKLLVVARDALEASQGGQLTNGEKYVANLGAIVGKLAVRQGLLDEGRELFSLVESLGVMESVDYWAAYALMLEGEILLSEGDSRAALARLGESLTALNSLQVQESLAYAHRKNGELAQAIERYEWLIARRGRTYVECQELCFDWGLNVIGWPVYHFEAAELYREQGQEQRAAELYRAFLTEWDRFGAGPEAGLPLVRAAREALAQMGLTETAGAS